MLSFALRRLASALLTLLLISALVFTIIHLAPGDPATTLLAKTGGRLSPQAIDGFRRDLGLDRPLVEQYARWLSRSLQLDFGRSIEYRRPVLDVIVEKLPATILLNGLALLLAVLIGVPFGALLAARGGLLDRIASPALLAIYSLPAFWVALTLIDFASMRHEWFPLFGMMSDSAASWPMTSRLADRAWHMVLPLIVLTYGEAAVFARLARSAVLSEISADHVRTILAMGGSRSRALRRALRSSAVPLITAIGSSIPWILSGSVVVERIFAWDGLGHLFLTAALMRDYPLIMGLVTVTAWVTLAAFLVTDLLYLWADPRIRPGQAVIA